MNFEPLSWWITLPEYWRVEHDCLHPDLSSKSSQLIFSYFLTYFWICHKFVKSQFYDIFIEVCKKILCENGLNWFCDLIVALPNSLKQVLKTEQASSREILILFSILLWLSSISSHWRPNHLFHRWQIAVIVPWRHSNGRF